MLEAAETLQRIAYGIPLDDFSCGAGWVWLDAATRGGAAAGLLETTGELAPGKEADFLILDMALPEVLPSWDFSWEVVRFYSRLNLLGCFVAGAPTVLYGRMTQFEGEAFVSKYRGYAARRVSASGVSCVNGPSRQHRPGGQN